MGRGVFGEPFSTASKIGWIGYRDVAEVAAIALTDDTLTYDAFDLCAQVADRREIAATMSEVLGRPFQAAAPRFDDWAADVGPLPFSVEQLRRIADMCAFYDQHGLPGNSLVLRAVLDRRPRTLRDYLQDLAAGTPTQGAWAERPNRQRPQGSSCGPPQQLMAGASGFFADTRPLWSMLGGADVGVDGFADVTGCVFR